jgi:hypothetical protein
MEYMLMPDGTVQVFPVQLNADDVRDLLSLHMGVAFYWNHTTKGEFIGWSVMHADCLCGTVADSVPDVIKLAAMLQ